MCERGLASCGTTEILLRISLAFLTAFNPKIAIEPEEGSSCVDAIRMKVVFPAPFLPKMVKIFFPDTSMSR